MKKIFSIDFDDTLIAFGQGWKKYYLEVHGKSEEVDWNVPEHLALGWAFIRSNHHNQIEEVDGATEALRKIATKRTLVITTFRDSALRDPTIRLMELRFPKVFRDVYFINQNGQNALGTKANVCSKIGATEHVDDSVHVAQEVHTAGIRSFLFGTESNKDTIIPGVPRVSWEILPDYID